MGFTPVVFTLLEKGALAQKLEQAGISVLAPTFPAWLSRLPSFVKTVLKLFIASASLASQYRRGKPWIVHFFLPQAYLVGGLVSLFTPSCIRVMSRRSLNNYQLRHHLLARCERFLHKRMDAVLGNSLAVLSDLRAEGVAQARLHLIYNGVDLAGFHRVPSARLVLQPMGVHEEALVITCVANLLAYKGHQDLLSALACIKDVLPVQWVLLLVGRDGGIQASLEHQALQLGISHRIFWLGSRTDVRDIYAASDIGVLCSHEEGFSNSILEGMGCELPMVVTDVGGNAEAVLHGHCGLVVPSQSPEALAHALQQLACNPALRVQFAKAARARAMALFSIDACVAKYDILYRQLITSVSTTHLEGP